MNEDESIFTSRCVVVVLKKKNKSTRLNTSKDEALTSKEEALTRVRNTHSRVRNEHVQKAKFEYETQT